MQIFPNLKTTKSQVFLRPSSLEMGYSTCIAIAMSYTKGMTNV